MANVESIVALYRSVTAHALQVLRPFGKTLLDGFHDHLAASARDQHLLIRGLNNRPESRWETTE